jgi:hypothetical protein
MRFRAKQLRRVRSSSAIKFNGALQPPGTRRRVPRAGAQAPVTITLKAPFKHIFRAFDPTKSRLLLAHPVRTPPATGFSHRCRVSGFFVPHVATWHWFYNRSIRVDARQGCSMSLVSLHTSDTHTTHTHSYLHYNSVPFTPYFIWGLPKHVTDFLVLLFSDVLTQLCIHPTIVHHASYTDPVICGNDDAG